MTDITTEVATPLQETAEEEPTPTDFNDTGPDWGFLDKDGTFVAVPKRPIQLANIEPPFEIMTWEGARKIIVRPSE